MAGGRRGRFLRALAGWAICALLFAAPRASAHIVYGGNTLRQLTLESDLVVRARIADPAAELWLEEPLLREAVVVAEVLEVLKGASEVGAELRFVQHGHGVPLYAKDEEVLLFLRRIERSRELGASGLAAHIRFVSVQEGERFALAAATRDAFTAAVGAYAELGRLPAASRLDALRRITLSLLASPDPELAGSALRDLVLAGDTPLLRRDDLPALERVLARAQTPIGVRIGLVAELERRGFLDAAPRWAELVRTTSGADRLAAVRAAGVHPSEPVAKELTRLLGSEDALLVAAAAVALGAPGSASAVAPLAKLLASPEPRVRTAAIRGLGKIGTPGAREALAKAAASHPDAATRRRAGAQVKLLERGAAPSPGAAP